MRHLRYIATLAFALTFYCDRAPADLILTLGNVADVGNNDDSPFGPIVAGESISIPVLAHLEGPVTPPLTAYTFTLDIGGDGAGISPFFAAPTFQSNVGGTLVTDDSLSGPLPIDFTINWFGAAQISVDPSSPTTILTIDIGTLSTTPAGVYEINFGTDAGSSALTSFTANGANFTAQNVVFDDGQFVVAAVPEPTGLIPIMALGYFGLVVRRKKV